MDWTAALKQAQQFYSEHKELVLTLFSGGAFVAFAWFFSFFQWLIELSRKRPTSDAERIARLLAEQARKLGAAEQREKDYQSAIDAMDMDRAGRDFVHGKFERISRQAGRAADIIDQSRNFDRKADNKPQVFDPREAVLWARSVMGEHLRLRDIKVVTRIPDRCRRVSGHDIRFKHVVLNLLTNARDAIELRGGNKEAAFERRIDLEVSDDPSADTLRIRVRDTGSGIPEAVIGHIFEPYFTTKEVGHGTGLGLTVSYGMVTEMGGALEARNGDEGAEITISLPAVGGHAQPARVSRPVRKFGEGGVGPVRGGSLGPLPAPPWATHTGAGSAARPTPPLFVLV